LSERFQGKNGSMSSGAFPPATAEVLKYHVSHDRGWSLQRAGAAASEEHRMSLDTLVAEGDWWVG
jgi:hypothetical protein